MPAFKTFFDERWEVASWLTLVAGLAVIFLGMFEIATPQPWVGLGLVALSLTALVGERIGRIQAGPRGVGVEPGEAKPDKSKL